jgi:CRISPR/Cas system CSM-associated protein Csm3 (group 7 of RAMP superfamily)
MIITVLKAVIEAEAGWAVGAADSGLAGLDRELLTDARGCPWVPPSSLGGSLRAHLTGLGADERLMGSRPPAPDRLRSAEPPELGPSALWLLGTRIYRAKGDDGDEDPAGRPATTVEANTAVDPRRRAALPRSLRHSRVVDEPTVIELYAQFDGRLPDGDLKLLASWRPQIGRDRTRGGGSARLSSIGYRFYDLSQDDDLRAWLEAPGPDRFGPLTDLRVTGESDDLLIDDEFEIAGALHVGTGSRRDKVSVTRMRDGQPLVPGSSWKGLFRARAGYIVRTCWGEDAACTCQTGCGKCLVCDIFGSAARRGRIAFRSSAITTADSPQTLNHVAIDRVSGGARDKLLFSDDVITSGTLKLTITALDVVEPWQGDLLRHVERDIHDGLIGVGGGAQRGQGTLRLTAASQASLANLQPMPDSPPPGAAHVAAKSAEEAAR